MNKGVLIFLLLIPAAIALGHDALIYYENQEEGFKLSDLGWLWTNYHPESHDAMFEEFGIEKWKQYMLPILSMPSVMAALIFSGVILVFVMIIKALASIGSGKFSPKRKTTDLGRSRTDKKQFKYNRR